MKLVVRIAIALAVLIILGIVGVFLYIDSIARTAVERGATDALGVTTTLDSADVGVFGGTFAMSGLRVSNPPGFSSNPFVALDDGNVAVSLGTLRKETVELPLLHLTGLDVSVEKTKGESNYGVILENVKGDREPEPEDADAKKYVIREVAIRDVNVRVSFAPIGGDPTVINVPIAEITLTDVGADRPLPLSELAGVVVQAVLATVVEQGGALLPTDLFNDLAGQLAQLGDLEDLGISIATDLGERAEEMLNEVGQQIGGEVDKAAKEIEDRLKGIGGDLFPQRKNSSGGGK